MAQFDDFGHDLETPSDAPLVSEATDAPRPLVLVQYRDRDRLLSALLIPPLIVLTATTLILSRRAGPPSWVTRLAAPPSLPSPTEDRTPGGPAIVLQVKTLPSAPTPPVPSPEAGPGEVEVVTAPSDVGPRSESPIVADAAAVLPPGSIPDRLDDPSLTEESGAVTAEEDIEVITPDRPEDDAARRARLDILRESEQKKQELARLQAEKQQLAADEDRALLERRRESARALERERGEFLDALRQVLDARGKGAAPAIASLISRYDREPSPEVRDALVRALDNGAGRYGRARRIRLFRAYGVPETKILIHLAGQEAGSIPSRHGPRNHAEALVTAAWHLIAVPVNAPPPPVPTRPSVHTAPRSRPAGR